MLQRLKIYEEIVVALVTEGLVMKALDFMLENNVSSMKASSFLHMVEKFKNEGETRKADLILKRITEIKKFDETKLKLDPSYRPILIEE